jgi:hypothetical protein
MVQATKVKLGKSIPLGLQLPRTKVVAKETHGEKKPIKTIHANYLARREEVIRLKRIYNFRCSMLVFTSFS